MQWILKKILGTKTERDLKKLRPLVDRINKLEKEYQALTEVEIKAKTQEFRDRYAKGETLDDLLCEAFAAVKNACRRMVGTTTQVCDHDLPWEMVPFDVQLIGSMVMHQGKIAEMATGEGKTLVATMPVYLNAISGKGVHVITVNDYLARRDAQWMGAVYTYLGLTVGCIQNQMRPDERRIEYCKDITYGTNSEFGFDYLRDNMATTPADRVQRGYAYAIIDEIDSILIDEARTPLIISGPAPYNVNQYKDLRPVVDHLVRRQRDLCNRLISEAKKLIDEDDLEEAKYKLYQVSQGMPRNKQFLHLLEEPRNRRLLEKVESAMMTDMHKEHARALREELFFTIDEKGSDANLTEKGCEAINPQDPTAYVLPDLITAIADVENDDSLNNKQKINRCQELQEEFGLKNERIHAVDQLIRAFCCYERDVQYVVQDNQVVIVDEYTGRIMPGRRWSDGLHQAIEAKEGVRVERETQTLATITIQNYFRMYDKLAGMTGTAETEADEFQQIYKLDVVVIPTNRPVRRVDGDDQVYRTLREKYKAIIDLIEDCHQRKQPVLVGTVTVETSELISRMLRRRNIMHNVLNAKHHEREAEIVARAGQPGAVTIATNMAGRGTDIKLGKGVIYIERETITSQEISLDSPYNGSTLREVLRENPCGLFVIGTERHESRRIDRQLRGRCARQGDPGHTMFFVSLEDELMRLYGADRMAGMLERFGLEEGEVITHPWMNRSIETAQRRIEQSNFSIRKRTLEYDDVMNKQREVVYGFRTDILCASNTQDELYAILDDVIFTQAEIDINGGPDERKIFVDWANSTFPIGITVDDLPLGADVTAEMLTSTVMERVKQAYELKVASEDREALTVLERMIMLDAVDTLWQEYLRSVDALREGVRLRVYAQRDPLVEYKREAYMMFADLMDKIKTGIALRVFRTATSQAAHTNFLRSLPMNAVHEQPKAIGGIPGGDGKHDPRQNRTHSQEDENDLIKSALDKTVSLKRDPKVGRNSPCPCGSGKKYKKCCGA